MTNTKRVSCKDCRWFKHVFNPIQHGMFQESHDCLKTLVYDSVYGDVKGCTSCYDKNINCDCSDYEAKEVGDG